MHSQTRHLIHQLVKPSVREPNSFIPVNTYLGFFFVQMFQASVLPINSVSSDYLTDTLSLADPSLLLLYITYPRDIYFEIKDKKKRMVLLGKTIPEGINFPS